MSFLYLATSSSLCYENYYFLFASVLVRPCPTLAGQRTSAHVGTILKHSPETDDFRRAAVKSVHIVQSDQLIARWKAKWLK